MSRRKASPIRFLSLPLLLLALWAAPLALPGMPQGPRVGARGYGLTVFSGTTVSRFPVTVLGRAPGALGGADMILVRVDDGYLRREKLGIVAGMSGSPVFIDGRLIGAIGYGWSFSKEPIGGVTPIESMLEELPTAPRSPWGEAVPLSEPVDLGGRTFTHVRVSQNPGVESGGTLHFSPVSTLLQLEGFSPATLADLAGELEPLGLTPVHVPSGGSIPRTGGDLVPGSAVGVQLMSGDLEAASSGTLTWREGNRVLAFGHPMAGLGDVRLPLSAAYVHGVLPSYQKSFKFTSQMGIVGELTSDRLWAVAGELHSPAMMVPAELQVLDRIRDRRQQYRLKAAQHPLLTPLLLKGAAAELLHSNLASSQEATTRARLFIDSTAGDPIELELMSSGPGADAVVADRIGTVLQAMTQNVHEPLKIRSIRAEIELLPGNRSAEIVRVTTDRDTYRPGETVRAVVELAPYGNARERHEVAVEIPPDASPGTLRLNVLGGSEASSSRKGQAPFENPPEPEDLASLLNLIRHGEKDSDLVVHLLMPGKGPEIAGIPFSALPSGSRRWLENAPDTLVAPQKEARSQRLATRWFVRGQETLELQLKATEKLKSEPLKPAPKPPKAADPPSSTPIKELPGGGRRWVVNTAGQLAAGEFQGLGLSDTGIVKHAAPGPLAPLDRPIAWCVGSFQGRPAFGAAASGDVLTEDGARFAATGQPAVTAILGVSDALWVGTAPYGRLQRYAADGKRVLQLPLPSSYIWDLSAAPDGLFVAGGIPGALYRVEPGGSVRTLWEAPDRHVKGLARDPQGNLYLATSDRAMLYRLAPGAAEPLLLGTLDSPGIEDLAWLDGSLYAAAGDRVYRISENGDLLDRIDLGEDGPALALAALGSELWVGGARSGALYRYDPGQRSLLRTGIPNCRSVPALSAEGGRLTAATAFPGGWSRVAESTLGIYTSPVLDAGTTSRWGNLRWSSPPQGAAPARAQTRSGPSPRPDDSWSEWSPSSEQAGGTTVGSPPARYLQIRFAVEGSGLDGFEVSYLPLRPAPQVDWLSPLSGQRWGKNGSAHWKLTEDSPEALDYSLAVGTGDSEWKTLRARAAWGPEPNATFAWTASGLGDGRYRFQLKVYRGQDSEPALTSLSPWFSLATTPPSLSITRVQHESDGLRLQGLALSAQADIVEVSYRIGPSPWRVAAPVDGLFDSCKESFLVRLPTGTGQVEIRAEDETGLTSTLSRQL